MGKKKLLLRGVLFSIIFYYLSFKNKQNPQQATHVYYIPDF